MDVQYARTLVETGIIGLAAFLALLGASLRSGLAALRRLQQPEDRGLALGFIAGLVGLSFHALGSNTFIIVRIMEPFWFFAGVVVVLPMLQEAESPAGTQPARTVRYAL
jgi:O-antigen ligase